MSRSKKLSMRRIRRYLQNKEGTAAIEFAILAIPFFMLIFAVLELAIVFFMTSNLNHALNEVGRQIRVGSFNACSSKDAFKEQVCEVMAGNGICREALRIDVVSGDSFASIKLPPPPGPDPENPDQEIDIDDNSIWDDRSANPDVPIVIRGLYYHPLALPSKLSQLSNVEGQDIRILTAITAFKNEPFGTPDQCPGA